MNFSIKFFFRKHKSIEIEQNSYHENNVLPGMKLRKIKILYITLISYLFDGSHAWSHNSKVKLNKKEENFRRQKIQDGES